MKSLYSYVLRTDSGAAPNPFGGLCTLTICKPVIRRTAGLGDWIVGLGAKQVKSNDGQIHDYSNHLVYAMKISKIMTLQEYDTWCEANLPVKIPVIQAKDKQKCVGDCIYYDFPSPLVLPAKGRPCIRPSVHTVINRDHDLSGLNALLSDHFYYFGENAVPLEEAFRSFTIGRGHRKITDPSLIEQFEAWLSSNYEKNKLYGLPQQFEARVKKLLENRPSACSY
jgi:hypothetical protein